MVTDDVELMPVSTKPFFLTYTSNGRLTYVRKKWLSGQRLFANRPADTVSSPRPMVDSGRQHPSEKRDGGQIGSVNVKEAVFAGDRVNYSSVCSEGEERVFSL